MLSALAAYILISASSNLPTFEAIVRNGYALSKDQFARPEEVPPLASPEFVVGFSDGNARDPLQTSAFYVYEQGALELVFAPSSDSNVMDTILTRDPLIYWSSAVVYSHLELTRTGIAENGFGQRFRVSYFEGQAIRLDFDHGPKPSKAGLQFKKIMPPDEAKRLSSEARVRIILVEPRQVRLSGPCDHTGTSATFARPTQVNTLQCVISSEVSAIEIFDSRSGEVLVRKPFAEGTKRNGTHG